MITADQRKRYWVELHAAHAQSSALSPQSLDDFRADFHQRHNLPKSTKDFTKAHFDTFLAACRAITQPADLKPQLRALNQPKARLLHKILVEQAAQLKALGKADPQMTITQICKQKFIGAYPADLSADAPPGKQYSDLDKLLFTVARTISELRQKRGWTVHELLWESGLGATCECANCSRGIRRPGHKPQPKKSELTDAPF